ncbi:MAG: anti-sigma factor [Candidatus Promineifilaceae bacterium]|nr:anti-sigma factor [Anaerolineaceae bacterium]
MNERFEDLLAVYVLGGLSPEEEAGVEAYIAENPQAAAQLAEAYAAAALLPYAAPLLEPSPEAEAALFARVQADLVKTAVPVRQTAVSATPKIPTLWDQLRAFFSTPLVTGLSLATAVLLLIWGMSLNRQVQELDQNMQQLTADNSSLRTDFDALSGENLALTGRLTELQTANQTLDQQIDDLAQTNVDLVAANNRLQTDLADSQTYSASLEAQIAEIVASQPFASPQVFAVTVPGTEEQPEASAQLVVDPEANTAMLIVDGMPELPDGSVYQVLLIRGTEHETAETFRVDTQGEGVLLVHSTQPLRSFDAVGVSIEPEGGSVQRTGDIVLLGSLVN